MPPGRLIGYARVSTDDQSLDMQRDALLRAGVHPDNMHEDKVSAVAKRRPGLEMALKDCVENDTLVVWKLDRFGRSLLSLLNGIQTLEARGVGFKSLTEGIDTTTPAGRMLLHMLGALAQFERDLIAERTKAGIAAAKARGKRFGPKQKLDVEGATEMFRAGKGIDEVAARYDVTRQGVYRYFNKSAVVALQDEGREARRRKRKKL